MLKKEAKEYRLNLLPELKEKIQKGCNCTELMDIELAYQKGAEAGYNKAKENGIEWHNLRKTRRTCLRITIAALRT